MNRWVAFLRGMNLGGRRITNRDLQAEFEALGFADVATFRASGNVIFGDDRRDAEPDLAARVEAGLGEALGYAVPVYLRDRDELGEIAAMEPFDRELVAASKGKLQVLFLAGEPGAKARHEALAHCSDDDRLAIAGRQLYWLPSGGVSETDLDLKAIERALGPGTMRTMGTVEQIAARVVS